MPCSCLAEVESRWPRILDTSSLFVRGPPPMVPEPPMPGWPMRDPWTRVCDRLRELRDRGRIRCTYVLSRSAGGVLERVAQHPRGRRRRFARPRDAMRDPMQRLSEAGAWREDGRTRASERTRDPRFARRAGGRSPSDLVVRAAALVGRIGHVVGSRSVPIRDRDGFTRRFAR